MTLEQKPASDRDSDHGSLLVLAVLALIVGAVSGLVGALFLLLLERADRFRDALIVWAHSKAFAGFLVVSIACAAGAAVAAWLVRRYSPHAAGWLGCGDPVRTMAAASEDDPERQAFGAVLEAWSNVFSENSVTVAEIVKAACERDSAGGLVNEALHDALAAVAAARSGSIDNRRLGYWLRRNKDRRLGRRLLRRSGTNQDHVTRWQVRALA